MVPLNDGNCRLTIPVVKGRCTRDALPQAFHIGVFKFVKTISTAIEHIYKESANMIEGCFVIESMVTRARPSYTRDFLTLGICSLIMPAAMVKLMSFNAQIHTVML